MPTRPVGEEHRANKREVNIKVEYQEKKRGAGGAGGGDYVSDLFAFIIFEAQCLWYLIGWRFYLKLHVRRKGGADGP